KSLLRVSTHLRPTSFGVVSAIGFGAALLVVAYTGVALQQRVAGSIAAGLTLALIAFVIWRTSQAAAIVRRGLTRVAFDAGMAVMPPGPARTPIVAPALLRMYGLRSAIIFVIMIVSLGASTFVLREAATGPVIGGGKTVGPTEYGPGIDTWLDNPGGIVIAPDGDLFVADSNHHMIRRYLPNGDIEPIAGNADLGAGFSGDNGQALAAQLDTPDGVCIAPDGDVVVADSHNDRIRRVDRPTQIITTVAGSGESGYDGDEKQATEAALNTPSAVACARSGDIYIADTLNYRVRMIDAKTGLIHTIAGNGTPGDAINVGDGGLATSAHLNMPTDVQLDPNSGDIYIADMHHNRVRKVDAKSRIITTVAGSGVFGNTGDDGPAVQARLEGAAGIAVVPEPGGKVTIFIADFYSANVRAVGPDGIIRNLTDEARVSFDQPTRVAYSARRGLLWVADASTNVIKSLAIPKIAPNLVPPPRPANPTRRVGG
ncbi:MAG TPA: hypothetical protein VGY57_13105, partial [Vicinamibacterales bacterium]|nr:hypothetical protein [Vicinamibacterales bacterium]